jgi:hypothetical protein
MFKQVLQILLVQLLLIVCVSVAVTFSRKHESFFNSSDYPVLATNYNGQSYPSMNAKITRDLNPESYRIYGNNNQTGRHQLDIQLDSTLSAMNLSTFDLSHEANQRRSFKDRNNYTAQAGKNIVTYNINGNDPSVTYWAPVTMSNLTILGSFNSGRDLTVSSNLTVGKNITGASNLTVLGNISAARNVSGDRIQTKELALDNGWVVGGGGPASLVMKNANTSMTMTNNAISTPGSLNAATVNGTNANFATVNANSINMAQNASCIGRNAKMCFDDASGNDVNRIRFVGDASFSNAVINNAGINWAAMNGASIDGIRISKKVKTDEKGENPKITQVLDADYIELKNDKILGADHGEIKIGNFRLVEDSVKPGRLTVYFKTKPVAELDATGSRTTELYLYNRDNNENYVYMSSGTKTITKNARMEE